MVSYRGRIAKAAASVVLLVGAGLVVASSPAAAAGGEHGVLRIKGPGSLYAGSLAGIAVVTTPGGTATFTFQVKNTGTATSQYNIRVIDAGCGPAPCTAATKVSSGSLVVTTLTVGPNGYFTAPINAGASATYSFGVTVPKTAVPGAYYQHFLNLYGTAGVQLDGEDAITEVKRTTGTRAYDEFINAAGQQPISGEHYGIGAVSTPVLALGAKSTFTVKLVNNSSTPTAMFWRLHELAGCAADFAVTVKAGSVDITATAYPTSTYATPVLAPKGSKVLTITIQYLTNVHGCSSGSFGRWNADSFLPGGFSSEYMDLYVPVVP